VTHVSWDVFEYKSEDRALPGDVQIPINPLSQTFKQLFHVKYLSRVAAVVTTPVGCHIGDGRNRTKVKLTYRSNFSVANDLSLCEMREGPGNQNEEFAVSPYAFIKPFRTASNKIVGITELICWYAFT
jgi:hypothetical protein